jgi:hypothetical protein
MKSSSIGCGCTRRRGLTLWHSSSGLPRRAVPPVVRFLLKEYMEEVDGTLAMNFRSGSWKGSEVSYLEQKIEVARSWLVL